jgi:glycogen debranching enzyme
MGHCLATEIVDEEKIPLVVKALMSEELFSGWGIRTLSNKNPGYDPYSYHRGSVWPVENAIIADGFSMHGYCEEANHIMTAQLGLAAMFQHMRLPEVISGHARSPESPVPGIYSYANLLQSWSVSAIAQYLQVMLGLMPRAEQGVLYLKPHLPEWLSWIELKNLKVGHAKLHLRFWRDEKGHTQWSVVNQSGELEVRSVFASKAKAA